MTRTTEISFVCLVGLFKSISCICLFFSFFSYFCPLFFPIFPRFVCSPSSSFSSSAILRPVFFACPAYEKPHPSSSSSSSSSSDITTGVFSLFQISPLCFAPPFISPTLPLSNLLLSFPFPSLFSSSHSSLGLCILIFTVPERGHHQLSSLLLFKVIWCPRLFGCLAKGCIGVCMLCRCFCTTLPRTSFCTTEYQCFAALSIGLPSVFLRWSSYSIFGHLLAFALHSLLISLYPSLCH